MKDMELQKRIENAVDTTLASLNPSARECDLLIENSSARRRSFALPLFNCPVYMV